MADLNKGLASALQTEDLLPAPDREIKIMGRVPAGASREETLRYLEEAATEARRRGIQTIRGAGAGHIGGEFSITDALVTLYLAVMNISPQQVEESDPGRDRLVLSKGHAANALYTTLALAGYIDPLALRTFLKPGSMLNGHPARGKINAVEANTGPLGHGLPISVGMALAAKLDESARRVFVLLGDGEMQEGSNWEAMMTASQYRLANLTALVDRNHLQQGATVQDTNDLAPLREKIEAFGWRVTEINGHDYSELLDAFLQAPDDGGRPTFIIYNSHKGYPVSFMMDKVKWHHGVPSEEQTEMALAELDKVLERVQ